MTVLRHNPELDPVPCDVCERPIKTRYMMSYAIGSAADSYMIVTCAVCWGDLVPNYVSRLLNAIGRKHPLPREDLGIS